MVSIRILDVNEAPQLSAQFLTVTENCAVGTSAVSSVPFITGAPGVDVDAGDVLTYARHCLHSSCPGFLHCSGCPGGLDRPACWCSLFTLMRHGLSDSDVYCCRYSLRNTTALFAVNPTTGRVTVASASLNFEVRSSYLFVTRVTDAAGLFAEAPMSISVLDDNDPPVFAGTTVSVLENSTVGAVVGPPLAVADEDSFEASIVCTGVCVLLRCGSHTLARPSG